MNGFNLSDIIDAKLGATNLGSIYLGSTKLWPLRDYSQEYLTIESLVNNNTITWSFTGTSGIYSTYIYWSTDAENWNSVLIPTQSTVTLTTLNIGERVYLKSTNSYYATGTAAYSNINANGNFKIYGNIMSLLYGDNFVGKTGLPNFGFIFMGLFRSTYLIDASNLILPATTLRANCYNDMFNGCTSLTAPPALPATTLAASCYKRMFQGCTALVNAPELPALTLQEQCYQYMFDACSSLKTIKFLATTYVNNSTYRWVRNVSSSGTFTKKSSMTSLGTGVSGIPSGWTIVNI